MSFFGVKHWIFATGGVLVGGLVIQTIGFPGGYARRGGMRQFFKTCLWLNGGATVTAVSTVILKFIGVSDMLNKYPRLTFISSVIGLIKFYPSLGPPEQNASLNFKKICSCIVFWAVPSIYFCIYNFVTLEGALLCTIYLLTVCFTFGTIFSLKNTLISDFGLKLALIGISCVVVGVGILLVTWSSNIFIDVGIVILLSGILIDDLQHLKLKYNDINSDRDITLTNIEQGVRHGDNVVRIDVFNFVDSISPSVAFSSLKQSLTIFVESVLIYGRIAAILGTVSGHFSA